MYDKFTLEDKEVILCGYDWTLTNPDYVICLVHGIGEYAGRYDRIGELFKSANIAMTGIDLRGHGHSSGKRGHVAPRDQILSDISDLIEYTIKKYEGKPLILYGHSLGGNIVLDYRRRGKLRSIPTACLVTSPWIVLVNKIPAYLNVFVQVMNKIKPSFTINTKMTSEDRENQTNPNEKGPNQNLLHGEISVQTARESYLIGEKLMVGTLDKTGEEPLSRMLLMHGDSDKSCSPIGSRKVAELEKELCEYIEWKGYSHELHNGNDTNDGIEIISFMIDWIRRL